MIESYSTTSDGFLTLVTVVSNLSAPVYYNWFQDGEFLSQTLNAPEFTFFVAADQQTNIVCVDSNYATLSDFSDDFNDDFGWDMSIAGVPGFPSTRTLEFVRSLDPTIASYEIQQAENGGSWDTIGFVADDPSRWSFSFVTAPLDDLAFYAWRVVPIGQTGNAGTSVSIAAETIVRTPDAPAFSVTLNGSQELVFAAA